MLFYGGKSVGANFDRAEMPQYEPHVREPVGEV